MKFNIRQTCVMDYVWLLTFILLSSFILTVLYMNLASIILWLSPFLYFHQPSLPCYVTDIGHNALRGIKGSLPSMHPAYFFNNQTSLKGQRFLTLSGSLFISQVVFHQSNSIQPRTLFNQSYILSVKYESSYPNTRLNETDQAGFSATIKK